MGLFERIRGGGPTQVGLLVDGPNVLRDEFNVDLADVRTRADAYGRLATATLYLDEHAPPNLIKAGEAHGFEVVTTSGDVDVKLGVDGAALVCTDTIDTLVLASRDTDFKPLLELAASRGVHTVALAPGEHGRSDALRRTAQDAVSLDGDR
jgi:uncharacterized protein (TIGR00288 family)